MGVFNLESFLLISGISGFSFFAIDIFENPETTENFCKLIFRVMKTIYYDLEHFSKHFVWSGLNFQSVAQSYQGELTIEAWK